MDDSHSKEKNGESSTYSDPVFEALVGSTKLTLFNKNTSSSSTFTIPLMHADVKTLKFKAFKQALGEAIRYLFYVNFALVKQDVKTSDDLFGSGTRLFAAISPVLSSMVPNEQFGLKINLAFSMLNVLLELIRVNDQMKALEAANNVVEAFQGGYGRINIDLLKSIIQTFSKRYFHQIERMTISVSTQGQLRLHERDGVVQFANVLAKRIGTHIMKAKNQYYNDADTPFLKGIQDFGYSIKVGVQKRIGEVQNIKPRVKLPTVQRCLLATWQEIDGYEMEIECDSVTMGKYITWTAGDILTQTGIRNIANPTEICERPDNFNSEVGYIYADKGEAQQRGYDEFRINQSSSSNANNALLATPQK